MSETRATEPAFPPDRYGRRRDGRPRLAVPVIVCALVLAACVLISMRLYRQYGHLDYDAQIVGWTGVTDTRMTIEFTVRVPAGGSATCFLRARTYAGAEVGARTVTVTARDQDTTIEASEPVATTERAAVGEVVRCQPPVG